MSGKPLTVVTCCHNHGAFLKRCYHSLADQTLDKSKWKWLFLADGCTDDTEKLIRQYQRIESQVKEGLEIQVITKPQKQGLAVAKNFALRHVDTEFVAFQDADDQSMPDRLEMQLNIMDKGIPVFDGFVGLRASFQSIDVCGTLSWTELEDHRWVKSCFDVNQYHYDKDIAARIPYENIMTHGSVMARKSALDSVGGYPEDKNWLGMEDWKLWAQMIERGFRFYQIQERLYIWSGGTSVPR